MNADQFERKKQFSAALALANSLLAKGFVTNQEYKEIRRMFVQKYRPILGKL